VCLVKVFYYKVTLCLVYMCVVGIINPNHIQGKDAPSERGPFWGSRCGIGVPLYIRRYWERVILQDHRYKREGDIGTFVGLKGF